MFGVLVVEDEPVIAQQLATCVARNRWLTLAGTAATEQDAIDTARRVSPDLVLLDFGLSAPMAGFDVWHSLHKLVKAPKVIAVTAANEMSIVDRALTCGAFAYVVKPFTRATIDAKLADFVSFRRSPIATRPSADQRTIERIYNWRRSSHPLPAGLLRETLDAVVTVLRAAERPLRAEEIAARSGLKRETANRYLIYLSDQGIAVRAPEHGHPGHPAYLYTLAAMWNAPATP